MAINRRSGINPPECAAPARTAHPVLQFILGIVGILIVSGISLRADETNRFGFLGPEIFPIDNLISQLRAADIDGDGLTDLIVVNNARSRINILYNQTGKTNVAPARKVKRDLNELPPDARFRIESIASEKTISALAVADLNGDSRPDIAYFGVPKELLVQYNQKEGSWSTPRRWTMDDGLLDPNALANGDLNGDGREDLVMLAENVIYFLAQKPDGTLAEPEKIPYSGNVKAVQILDIDGDARSDLMLVNWEHAYPFRFRLQGPSGQLGPEFHFPLTPIRSYWMDDLDGDRKTEVITIAAKSGRAQVSHFAKRKADPINTTFLQGQFNILPFIKTTKSRRGITWADINRDSLSDLLVAEPDSGQLSVFLQQPNGSLSSARTFPTFTGVAEIAVCDWDGDGTPEIFLLSIDERQIGVSRLDQTGRIPFPNILPLEGRPLAMAVGQLYQREQPVLTAIVDIDGKRELQVRHANGSAKRQKLSESFKANPTSLVIHDINQDNRKDLVVLIPYEKMKVLLQTDDGQFEEHDVAPPGGSSEQPWVSTADVDGDGFDELLLAQKNFVRAVVLQQDPSLKGSTNRPSHTFRVKEQINGVSSSSRIIGAAQLKTQTNNVAYLFLLDADRRALTLCSRNSTAVWQTVRNIELPVSDFTAISTIALAATNANTVTCFGLNTAAWLPLFGDVWELTRLDDYETPIKDGYLHDVTSGDLDHDGRKDLVFLETAKNHLDIVTYEPPHRLVPANRWQVFEERTFKGRRPDIPEPREAVVVDLTGDGRNDLAILVHDRVLVYPQE